MEQIQIKRFKGEPMTEYLRRLKAATKPEKRAKSPKGKSIRNQSQISILKNVRNDLAYNGGPITIIIPFLTPGLNGDAGLMRQHYSRNNKLKREIYAIVRSQMPAMVPLDSVTIVYDRQTSRFMDWDNACASFKFIGDALVEAGILVDDNPKVVVNFVPKQTKVLRREERIVLTITPYDLDLDNDNKECLQDHTPDLEEPNS